jgi:hypothetical protein
VNILRIGVYEEQVAHVSKDFKVSISKQGKGFYQPLEESFEYDIENLKNIGATDFKFEKDKDGVKELSYRLFGRPYKLKRIDFIDEKTYQNIMQNDMKYMEVDFSVLDRIDKRARKQLAQRDPSQKDKLKYYKKRIDDQSLTSGQRKWALKRVNELQINI